MVWTILMWVVGLLVVAVAAILIIASTKPDAFRVERRIAIKAAAER